MSLDSTVKVSVDSALETFVTFCFSLSGRDGSFRYTGFWNEIQACVIMHAISQCIVHSTIK